MNVDLLTYDEETVPEELDGLGSYNHSYIQMELGLQLRQRGDFTVLPELSLDVEQLDEQLRASFKQEMKPDLAVYHGRPKPNFHKDILRMKEMPPLVIEVLSPTQSYRSLEQKIHAYFALGVQSCWIVAPMMKAMTVYHSADQATTYGTGQTVVDDVIGIEIPLSDIF